MLKYVIPFWYTVHSRSRGVHFLSYILMVFLPPLLLLWWGETWFSSCDVLVYVLAFAGMLSVYECGYLVNDVICIKKDPNPTERITEEERHALEKRLPLLVFLKICVCAVVSVILALKNPLHILPYAICCLLILLVYVAHNYFRNWINFITVFLLTTLNYFTAVSYFIPFLEYVFFVSMILGLFSVPKTFFYVLRKHSKNTVRHECIKFAVYYFALAVILLMLWQFHMIDAHFIFIPLYLGLYRLAVSLYGRGGAK